MPHPVAWYNGALYPGITTAMLEPDRRRLLGAFIRAHRERVRPDGSPGRRRTPGLRREELAARAAISATWCTWLEQGRPVQASPETLARLADALLLTRAERVYLFDLAGRADPRGLPDAVADAPEALLAIVRLLDQPAYGLDRLWNACCWNAAAARLFQGWLDGDQQRNLLHYVFLEPAARRLIPDWDARARRLLAEFRADYSHSFRDARVQRLVDVLRRHSPLFASAWDEHGVQQRAGGLRCFDHPEAGLTWFVQHTFSPSERSDYKLVVLVPVDATEPETSQSR
jgi:transcriptional regulator with XRE-family HTH domain